MTSPPFHLATFLVKVIPCILSCTFLIPFYGIFLLQFSMFLDLYRITETGYYRRNTKAYIIVQRFNPRTRAKKLRCSFNVSASLPLYKIIHISKTKSRTKNTWDVKIIFRSLRIVPENFTTFEKL